MPRELQLPPPGRGSPHPSLKLSLMRAGPLTCLQDTTDEELVEELNELTITNQQEKDNPIEKRTKDWNLYSTREETQTANKKCN